MVQVKEPTQEQREIIEYNGNIVVTARPGSGKTYTIVEKVCAILEPLAYHQGIIAISYTNKASDELKGRCRKKGIETKRSFFGTIDKFYISEIIIPFACHLTGCIADYQVVDNVPKEYDLLEESESLYGTEHARLLTDSLSKGLIFLPVVSQTALYLLKTIPGIIEASGIMVEAWHHKFTITY